MPISTRNLRSLPDIDGLRRLLQSMAMLDAILQPEWQYRYYSFNSQWSPGKQMGSMRDGCGDDLFALFTDAGAFVKGFAHESPMTPYRVRPNQRWPGVLDNVPAEFADGLNEPAFTMADTTFCIWRRYSDKSWKRGKIQFPKGVDPDGSASLLSPLDGNPATYKKWAEDYFEQSVHLTVTRQIYAHKPLTQLMVQRLNPGATWKDVLADCKEIGYPITVERKTRPR